MATLSETMTLAEFLTRVTAGTLNIGQIYTISDKGWVLQAHTNTVTKPLHGVFRINNVDSLPEGVEPDEIVLKFTNLNSNNLPSFSAIQNYLPVLAVAKHKSGDNLVIDLMDDDEAQVFSMSIAPGAYGASNNIGITNTSAYIATTYNFTNTSYTAEGVFDCEIFFRKLTI